MNERQIFKDVDGRIVAELQAQLDAANKRIAELEAAQRWVSVDERLPEVGANVVTKSRKGAYGVIMGVRNGGEWFYAICSHWMPLPPPPVTPET